VKGMSKCRIRTGPDFVTRFQEEADLEGDAIFAEGRAKSSMP
jgi:hypothetical protein